MPRRCHSLTAERLPLGRGSADADQLRRVAAGRPGRRCDEPHRTVEALRLRKPDLAELGPRASRHLGGDPCEHHLGIAAHPRQQVGDLHQARVAHLLELDLCRSGDRTERRERIGPRGTQRVEVSLERCERLRGAFHASILHPPTDIGIRAEIRTDRENRPVGNPTPSPPVEDKSPPTRHPTPVTSE